MARAIIDRDSLEYLSVPVTAPEGVTISGQPVAVAVVGTNARPDVGDWLTAAWVGSSARVLLGPGGALDLSAAPGTYRVFVRVTDSPEIPVMVAGTVVVA